MVILEVPNVMADEPGGDEAPVGMVFLSEVSCAGDGTAEAGPRALQPFTMGRPI
jgi:hypothetical protein